MFEIEHAVSHAKVDELVLRTLDALADHLSDCRAVFGQVGKIPERDGCVGALYSRSSESKDWFG